MAINGFCYSYNRVLKRNAIIECIKLPNALLRGWLSKMHFTNYPLMILTKLSWMIGVSHRSVCVHSVTHPHLNPTPRCSILNSGEWCILKILLDSCKKISDLASISSTSANNNRGRSLTNQILAKISLAKRQWSKLSDLPYETSYKNVWNLKKNKKRNKK